MAKLSFKQDNLVFGLILGFLAPLLGVTIYYFIRFFPTFSFGEFISVFTGNRTLLTGVSSLSLVANIILFTLYVNTRRDKTARGIFAATLVYGIAVMLYKLL